MISPIFSKDKNTLPKELRYVDAFEPQIKELFFIENHSFIGTPKHQAYKSAEFATFAEKMKDEFTYVHFPWNGHTIKTVEKEKYLSLKTNRNQDLITSMEQAKLHDFTVAVLGLSVGSNIALTLTQAGISNKIFLADYDTLDTTNLNRIIAGVHQIGQNKTDVSAQKIYEDNPFAEVVTMPEGVNEENLEVLLKAKKINCVVEEIDDTAIKIKVRMLAMNYKVPVIMITDNGDGDVLNVERYDLGHDKIFGSGEEYWNSMNLNDLSKAESGKIIITSMVGGIKNVDPKMLASVQRVIAKELVSWSQLGSAAILGGAVATSVVKKIALGEKTMTAFRLHIHPLDRLEYEEHTGPVLD